jgi:hypothetical protein
MLDRRLPRGARVLAPIALLASILLLLVLAGCGSGGSDASSTSASNPATVVPPDAAVYLQATLRPSGDMQDGVVAAARKVLHVQDPGAELQRLVDRGLADSPVPGPPTYARDVEPWLGDRAAVFVLPHGGDKPVAGFVAAVEDRDAFERELGRLRDAGQLRDGGSAGGVAYDLTRDGEPVGLVGDFAVLASTLDAFRAAVGASNGDSLADASRFGDATGDVPDDALAFVYADPKALVEAAGTLRDVPAQLRGALQRLAERGPAVASLTASADQIAIEGSASSRLLATDGSGAEVSVGQLPGDSWLALATPPLGPLVKSALTAAGVHDQAAAQLRATIGLELDRDVLDPLGGLGLFARGQSLLDVGAGVLLQMTSATAAQRLLTQLQVILAGGAGLPVHPTSVQGGSGFDVQIPQSPQPIVVIAKGDRVAAGYGASSAEELLDPQQRFDESSTGKAAIDTLGAGYTPSFVLIVPPLAALLRSLDQLQVVDLSNVLPYVNAYRSLAIGTKRDGDRISVRIVAALR